MADSQTRLVNIVKCEPGYHGTISRGQNAGDDYTIYNIEGLDENGQPIPRALNSFDNLPLGPAQYEVSRYDKPQNDGSVKTSFTLKPMKGARQAAPAQQAQAPGTGDTPTRAEYVALVRRVEAIEQIIAGRINQPDLTQPARAEPRSDVTPPAGAQWGDDPPW